MQALRHLLDNIARAIWKEGVGEKRNSACVKGFLLACSGEEIFQPVWNGVGGKKPKIHLVVHSHSPLTKTCSDFGFVWYCYLLQIFCRAVLAGFSQCHVCDQWEPCTFCTSYTLCACSTKVKNSCSLPANCNVSFKRLLLKGLWGQPQAARMSVNSMAVLWDWDRESSRTTMLLAFPKRHAGHPFSKLQKINMQGIY